MAKNAGTVRKSRYARETLIGYLVRSVRTYLKGYWPYHMASKCLDYSYLDFPHNYAVWRESAPVA